MMKLKTCPVCHANRTTEFTPFCSQRCREVDLGRWFTGKYVANGQDGDAFMSEDFLDLLENEKKL